MLMQLPTAIPQRSVVIQDRLQGMPCSEVPCEGSGGAAPSRHSMHSGRFRAGLSTLGGRGRKECECECGGWWVSVGKTLEREIEGIPQFPGLHTVHPPPLCDRVISCQNDDKSHSILKTATNYMWLSLLFITTGPTRRLLIKTEKHRNRHKEPHPQSVSLLPRAHCPGPGKP